MHKALSGVPSMHKRKRRRARRKKWERWRKNRRKEKKEEEKKNWDPGNVRYFQNFQMSYFGEDLTDI